MITSAGIDKMRMVRAKRDCLCRETRSSTDAAADDDL